MYTFEVSFVDGTVGEANSKTEEPPYKVGDEVYYEVVSNNERWGKKLKISKNPPQSFGGRKEDPAIQRRIENSWAIQTAVQILGVKRDKVTLKAYSVVLQETAESMLKLRDTLNQ
jgi:hypothetical protein